jgi:hypothetical protein
MQDPLPQSELDRFALQLYLRLASPLSRSLRLAGRLLINLVHRMNRLSGELLFLPLPGDLFLASYPRSGTTWLQMILYQLTTAGDMNFQHISELIPFLERALTMGHNLNTLNPPRIFKTHLPYRMLPKGPCKYIYIARDGRDVLFSYFHFHKSHMGYKGTLASFFEAFIQGQVGYGSWFQHVAEWQKHASDPNVLFLQYEDLAQDLSVWLPRIAEFCDLTIFRRTNTKVFASAAALRS